MAPRSMGLCNTSGWLFFLVFFFFNETLCNINIKNTLNQPIYKHSSASIFPVPNGKTCTNKKHFTKSFLTLARWELIFF